MHAQTVLGACALSLFSVSLAVPLAQTTGAGSCPSEALTAATWESLNIDTFLANWSAQNVTVTSTNNIQSLAASFGAPNFFCGLDDFCNAGQPCLPITLPAWYAMVAIQNWNSYMNSVNTAISFASSIAGLSLPGIVTDFFPNPKDNVTPLTTIAKIFTTILGVVPFTGPIATASSVITSGASFLLSQVKPPLQTNLFVQWSEITTTLSTVLQDYETAVATSIKATIDAPVNSSAGINSVLAGGNFLGVAQNFSQADLQTAVTGSINRFAISLIFQAQGIFIYRSNSSCTNAGDADVFGNSGLCAPNPDVPGTFLFYLMTKSTGNGNDASEVDFANLLVNKYGFTKEDFLMGPTNCFDLNGGKQLVDPFSTSLPLDPTTTCVFNLLVCDAPWPPSDQGIVDTCKTLGLPL